MDYFPSFVAMCKFYCCVDYFVLNVSSPNTPDLRALQDKEPLQKLLSAIQTLNKSKINPKPILLKIAPDLNESQLLDIVAIAKETGLAGIIATNTTLERSMLTSDPKQLETIGAGGLSGKPVTKISNEVLWFLRRELGNNMPIIGVGGIMNHHDVTEKINRGANLVQIYSGMVYEGQGMVKDILKKL